LIEVYLIVDDKSKVNERKYVSMTIPDEMIQDIKGIMGLDPIETLGHIIDLWSIKVLNKVTTL
jgi:hypothetical protein